MSFGNHDEDFNDDRQRCEHGTFIGSWWGPDYLCSWCEDGISREDQLKIMHSNYLHGTKCQLDETAHVVEVITKTMLGQYSAPKQPYNGRLAQAITDLVLEKLQYINRTTLVELYPEMAHVL